MVSGSPAFAKPVVGAPAPGRLRGEATTIGGQLGRGARGRPVFVNGLPSKGLAEAPSVGSAFGRLSLRGRCALLSAIPAGEALLVSAATITLPFATARLGMPRLPVATYATAPACLTSAEVRATESTSTSTPSDRYSHLLRVGALRGEKPQRGGYEGSAAELYRLTARDCAALQTHR